MVRSPFHHLETTGNGTTIRTREKITVRPVVIPGSRITRALVTMDLQVS